jgi:hypothetical protein
MHVWMYNKVSMATITDEDCKEVQGGTKQRINNYINML